MAPVYDDQAREQLNPGCARGLVWLVGMDGNDRSIDLHEVETQQRMLERRRQPVILLLMDRMPSGVPDPHNDGTESR